MIRTFPQPANVMQAFRSPIQLIPRRRANPPGGGVSAAPRRSSALSHQKNGHFLHRLREDSGGTVPRIRGPPCRPAQFIARLTKWCKKCKVGEAPPGSSQRFETTGRRAAPRKSLELYPGRGWTPREVGGYRPVARL